MIATVKTLQKRYQSNFPAALYVASQEIAESCRQECPVSPDGSHGKPAGTLRSTIRVVGPRHEGDKFYCLIVVGGHRAPYAVEVHEDTFARHSVGNAKFVEAPILANRSQLISRVGALSNRVTISAGGGLGDILTEED